MVVLPSVPVTVDISEQGTVIITKPNFVGAQFEVTMDWVVDQDNTYPLKTEVSTGGGDFADMVFCDSGPSIPDNVSWCVTDSHTFFDGGIKTLSETYIGNFDVTFKRHP